MLTHDINEVVVMHTEKRIRRVKVFFIRVKFIQYIKFHKIPISRDIPRRIRSKATIFFIC